MPYVRRRVRIPRRVGARLMRKYRPRRRYLPRRETPHSPRKFVISFKYADVTSDLAGTHPDGFGRYALKVNMAQVPSNTQLGTLYRQFAFTGVKFEYRSSNPSPNSVTGAQILLAENKDFQQEMSAAAMLSQDNCKKLVAHRNWNLYVSKPRPLLFQQDAVGNQIKVITPSKQIHWLSFGNEYDLALPHLAGQMSISDLVAGATVAQPQGEIWCKAYILVKEQQIVGL